MAASFPFRFGQLGGAGEPHLSATVFASAANPSPPAGRPLQSQVGDGHTCLTTVSSGGKTCRTPPRQPGNCVPNWTGSWSGCPLMGRANAVHGLLRPVGSPSKQPPMASPAGRPRRGREDPNIGAHGPQPGHPDNTARSSGSTGSRHGPTGSTPVTRPPPAGATTGSAQTRQQRVPLGQHRSRSRCSTTGQPVQTRE